MLEREFIFKEILLELKLREEFFMSEMMRLKESKSADTKSSAGDKFETGREMISQEIGKLGTSLKSLQLQQQVILGLSEKDAHEMIREGSVIQVGEKIFLLSVSLGEMRVGKERIFLLSKESPFGRTLLGKSKGDQVVFMGKPQEILQVY